MNWEKITLLVFFAAICSAAGAQPLEKWDITDIYVRDPYILPDAGTETYYLYRSSSTKGSKGQVLGGVETFKSKDLKTWEGPVKVFTVPEDNWITGVVWAPEVHFYNGRYYLFATLNSNIIWKARGDNKAEYQFRGTQIFHSDSPEGPFKPFDVVPHTPMDYMALDGTLWVENGKPYMVYCHEWVQLGDGAMNLVELKPNLSASKGNDMRLFNASAAAWSTGPDTYVTDGCFLYRSRTGKLLMIWSSFKDGSYAVGIAESTTGRIQGPWRQQEAPIFTKDGGHAMIFRNFEGRLCISLHAPNTSDGRERAHIFELEDTGETLVLKDEITEY